MHFFYQRKETNDEILFMFLHPYIFLLLLVVLGIAALLLFFVDYWLSKLLFFISNIATLIFTIEIWRILKEIRYAKYHGCCIEHSGHPFSYFDPWTITIEKEKLNSNQEKSITV